jgi:1,2-diacylglycerol 3-beta-galactosyltransferase
MKRILILMSKTGGGHLASAQALEAVFAEQYGDQVEVTIIDLLMDYLPWPVREAPKSYGWIANRTPWLWGTLYQTSHSRWLSRPILGATARLSSSDLLSAIVRHRPDLIVSVHPLVQELTFYALKRLGVKIPYAIVVTDLASLHPLWFHPQADRCFVASRTAYDTGLAAKMRPDQLRLYGLPVRPVFAQPVRPRAELRAALGMDLNLPAVLLVGGGDGIGRVAIIARTMARTLGAYGAPLGQMVVICGRNRRLQRALESEEWPIPVRVQGFVTNMSDWMGASDCIVTKAGPGTIAEALIRGLPILLSGYIPGQEKGNVPFVVDNAVGVFAKPPNEIAAQVARWFGRDRAALQTLSDNAQALANPQSTYKIVAELAEMIGLSEPASQPQT